VNDPAPINPYAAPDSELTVDSSVSAVKTAVIEWEKYRLIYNVVLLVLGLLFSAELLFAVPMMIIGVVIFGIGANVAYCLGPLVEMYSIAIRGEAFSRAARGTLFGVGLGFSVLVVLGIGLQIHLISI
jgi:hypothetical protein